jgi:YHS domain-containing protein
LVSDEKFEGSGMETYEFVHEGQTVKLCCKSCLKDFKKDPASYLKKLPKAKGPKTAQ